ncbi:glycosyltransferase [Nakamurella endophytica]|uniref:Glycosyl transferase n=1 Tax=Nakamurella endophytica TaxID=1748367 RepID=A0A917WJ59_9ACTN|nr:glycosyltransferase [Nakamurella endophytica]GGM08167.1 glycosyl transferase [Nakamurella endophytica]
MRVDLVSEHASPLATLGGVDAGGQNVHVAALAAELVRQGHDVTVHTRRDAPDLPGTVRTAAGYRVVHVDAGPAEPLGKDDLAVFMPQFGRELRRSWLRTGLPDVVHAHFWMSGVAALDAVRGTAVPVVQTFHALGTVKRRHQGDADTSPADRVTTETRVGRRVQRVVATCSDEVAELDRMGVPADRVRVVPCGVDVEHFTPRPAADGTGPAATDRIDPVGSRGRPRYRLLSVGRLVGRKGVDTVIEALPALPDVELVVAGGPPAADLHRDPEAVRLTRLAVRLGVADRLRLLGSVGRAELPDLYRSADVVLACPWYEPFGIVPLEAAASGRPVVGSAVGGLLDTVLPGVTGLLVPPRDPAALAGAVSGLLADPARREALGRAARRRAVDRYAWPAVAAATVDVYLEVAEPATVAAVAR